MVGLLFDHETIAADPRAMPEPMLPLRREQLIDRIVVMNPTACPMFLSRFNESRLEEYLDHLQAASEPRGSRWVRQASSPAIVWHVAPTD